MKKSGTLIGIFTVCLLFAMANSSAAESGRSFAIHSEVAIENERTEYYLLSGFSPADEPRATFGLRWYANDRWGIDLNFGMSAVSWVDEDTASYTYEMPGTRSIMVEAGIIYQVLKSERATLGVLGRLALNFNRWYEHYAYWVSPNTISGYQKYNVTIPRIFLGLEPSYHFSRSLSAFSDIGLSLTFVPNSKRIDYDRLAIVQPVDDVPLKDRSDSKTKFRTSGVSIGLRFHF